MTLALSQFSLLPREGKPLHTADHPVVHGGLPGESLLALCEELDSGLLVMGAYGKSTFYEFFFGWATKQILRESRRAVFLAA